MSSSAGSVAGTVTMRRETETRLQKLEAQRSGSGLHVVTSEQDAKALKASGVVKSGDSIVITGVPRADRERVTTIF